MILSQIGDYLKARGQASLSDIALHLDAEESAVRAMLAHWERRGRVQRVSSAPGCGSSCDKCSPSASELYVWRENHDIQEQPLPFPSCPKN